MRIVIAIDKFKGSASSMQLAQCIEHTILSHIPDAHITSVPIADGGDGTMHAIRAILGNRFAIHNIDVHRPILNLSQVKAQYLLDDSNHTAYMDLATASGLTLVPPKNRDIMSASTFGTGEMIADAINHGARHIVLGLGGSATSDGAIGLLAAMGCMFIDAQNNILTPCAASLKAIKRIDSRNLYNFTKDTAFTLLTDVNNPLLGPNGAAAIFAPQKGANPQQVIELESGLSNLSQFMPNEVISTPGAGAAGGVGAGMLAFLNATIVPGIDYLLEMAHFDEIITNAQFIITGEGRIDQQTVMGKAPAGVLRAAKRHDIPVIALCGCLAPDIDPSSLGFASVIEVTPHDMPLEQAMDTATTLSNVERAISSLISNCK